MLQGYDWEGALDACRRVLDCDPDHVGALEIMAQALWFGGRFNEVVTITTRLLRLNPYEPGYRYTRGMALLSQGRLGLAARDFSDAINQSRDPAFRAQVSDALTAVNGWQFGEGTSADGQRETIAQFLTPSTRSCSRPYLRLQRPS